MSSHAFALLAASVMVAGACALLFVVSSRRSLSSRYMSLWLTASMLVILCSISYLAEAPLGHPSVVVALANGTMVGAVGFVWLGCQAYNGQRIRSVPVLTVVMTIMLLTFLPHPFGPTWAGTLPKLLGLSVFSTLAAVESRRGTFGSFRMSWVITIAHALFALCACTRGAVLALQGPTGAVFETYFSVEITTVVSLAFVLINTIALVLIRLEGALSRRSRGATGRYISTRRLLDLHRRIPGCVLVVVEIVDLKVVRSAYGPAHAHELVTRLIDAARRSSPDAIAVASNSGGTVSVLLPESSAQDDIALAIQETYRGGASELADGYASMLRITTRSAART
ncbi:hypothetical protein ITJ66_16270 [Plantibacter sp. VKM Ac-2885]|uniref:hypothetical protein n=1 Tax=Plantibacter sp. VKM Ac-2885 TaxID=2783828 RepID=UPI00188C08D4|nr:hypothetical protein [Plantibacter sp. VKM Ac-2885]MBF4514042.1 hypothetical protein [Plantibacter sp. VKM Ac-2885]